MITPSELTKKDVGRKVIYHGSRRETGTLTSWNDHYIFVRFNGPDGEACRPCDIAFPLSAEVLSQFTGEQK
jgi:hypothetical protein